jgi:hypothetical protein
MIFIKAMRYLLTLLEKDGKSTSGSRMPPNLLHNKPARLKELSGRYQFSLFEYWLSDVAGHNQDMHQAHILRNLDQMLGGLIEAWRMMKA